MPDPVTATIGGVAGIGSALIGSRASRKAARAQRKGIERASDVQWKMYKQTREDLAPWRKKGVLALDELYRLIKAGPGEFEESPGYQFRKAEGLKALERSASARGQLLGGGTLKNIVRFGQDYATNEYDRFLNRYYNKLRPWQSMAGVGQTATTTLADVGSRTAGNVANLNVAGGQARASGYINQANILSDVIGGGTNLYLLNKMGAFKQ